MKDVEVPSGGSLLVAWRLNDRRVLIVGGGDVASGRVESVLAADANITLICPRPGLHPLTKRWLDAAPDRITYHDRLFAGPSDLGGVDMVLTAIDDVEASRAICELCRERRIPVNVADIPVSCDFYFGSQIRDGPLQVMISTNGQSPKLANIIRRNIENAIPPNAGQAISKVGVLRTKLRERAPGVGGPLSKRRMRWMIDVCTGWEMEELAALDDETMARLIDDGWENNRVPKPDEVGGSKARRIPQSAVPKSSSALLPATLGFVTGAAAVLAAGYMHVRHYRR